MSKLTMFMPTNTVILISTSIFNMIQSILKSYPFEKSFLLIQGYKGEKVWPWLSKWINSNTKMILNNTPLNRSNTLTQANCIKIVFCINDELDEGIWLVVLVYR